LRFKIWRVCYVYLVILAWETAPIYHLVLGRVFSRIFSRFSLSLSLSLSLIL
jgi:hypothetical protein